ncbi:MAG: 4'-phosphopantetheinyl transferase superfamily protein [Actinomycetota bacterium]
MEPPNRQRPADSASIAAAVESVVRELASSLGVELRTTVAPVDDRHVGALHDVETELVARAIPRRRAEFATGRVLLRRLLAVDDPIGRTTLGAPVVPPGEIVSLAHDRQIAVAVATTDASIAGVGIDVEPRQPLEPAMVRTIRRSDDDLDEPLAVFVAKEAVYKSWSAPGRRILEFHDVRLRRAAGTRGTLLSAHVAEDGSVIPVAVTSAGDRWVALAARPVSG